MENAIERAVVLGQSEVVLPDDLPETILESAAAAQEPGALVTSVTETKRRSPEASLAMPSRRSPGSAG